MACVRYTATRSVIAGHTAGVAYELNLQLSDLERQRNPAREQAVSIGGRRETIYHRAEITWRARTIPLSLTEVAAMREFLDSVEAGEQFEFDPYGSAGSATYTNAKISSRGYTESRTVRRGDGGGGDFFALGFQLIEV